jgi:hypothetical protein
LKLPVVDELQYQYQSNPCYQTDSSVDAVAGSVGGLLASKLTEVEMDLQVLKEAKKKMKKFQRD